MPIIPRTDGETLEVHCKEYRIRNFDTLVAWTPLGLCGAVPAWMPEAKQQLLTQFPGMTHAPAGERCDWSTFHLHGTPFQFAVWMEICKIGTGQTVTYGQIASALGKPEAARAVGAAVGANPLWNIIPCHRVVPKGYDWPRNVGGFRWGTDLKAFMLKKELDWEISWEGKDSQH